MINEEQKAPEPEKVPKEKKVRPVVKQVIDISVQVEPSFNGLYELIAIHPDGTEKAGTEFNISAKGYEKLYKHLTAGPEGTAQLAQFRVKKNPNL